MEDDEEVARGFDKITDIDQSKDVWVLAVRIVDLWPVIGKYKSESLEMIIKDAEADVIHITLPKEFLNAFKPQLFLNQTYEMENFKVSNNDSVVKACDHRFRLTITGATVISKQDFPDIPMASFNFKDFGEVLDGKYRPDLVVDVIGAFQDVTNTNRGNGRLRSITFTLKDASGNILHCCLWDDHAKLCADEFDKFDGTQPQPFVILVKHARVKPEQAPYPLCFTNTWDGTRVMFNPPLLDVALFKEKFKDLPSDALSLSQTASQYSQASQFSQNTDIMSNAKFLSLAEISNISQVEVTAVHKEEKIRFIFWDDLSASILKISAAELRKKMVRAGHTNPRTYPKTLDKLLQKKKVFKIKALPGGNPCSVLQVSDSEPLLANLEKQFGLVEASSSKEPLGLEMADIGTSSKQSVSLGFLELSSKDTSMVAVESLCGENDLSVTSSTPPAKRLSMDDTDSEVVPATQDVQPTQRSTTKVTKPPRNTKTPKTER
ncbi:putative nucleic acid-binding protein [Medicago truncatula]|uniref:Putative nucleic acid-binding protein n=1 Tax=Medicago truncatula TaxID=3880 RepID=A0A396I9A5_MEDTR|nr:putative nucleic acid-binding protein [Medicago truncatula]